MAAYTIDNFLSTLSKHKGPARAHSYLVHITSKKIGSRLTDICALCDTAELPGKSFDTSVYTMYGPPRKMPYKEQFGDLALSFICTNQMIEKRYFDFWQTLIVNPYTSNLGYYDEYVGEVYVFTLSPEHKLTYGVKFEEAYPLNVNPITLSYGDTNTYARLTVNFAYRKWTDIPVTIDDLIPSIDLGTFANELINVLVNI
jgi:hypothetical protein